MFAVFLADVIPDVTQFITDPAIALLILLSLAAIVALGKGLVVPKPIYDREVKRADKQEETNVAMLISQGTMTKAMEKMTEQMQALTAEVLRK